MSSKGQFKDALKRNNQTLHELKQENERLQRENINLRQLNHQYHQLKNKLSGFSKSYFFKKWWQFWK